MTVHPDQVTRRLAALADRYRATLAGVATVSSDEGGVLLDPVREGAVAVGWADLADEIVVGVRAPGGGGRFPTPGRTVEDVAVVQRLVDAVVGGRASGLTARHHARVEIRLDTGTVSDATAAGWPRRVRRTDFRAYRERTPAAERRR